MKITKLLTRYFLSLLMLNLAACSTMQTVDVERAMHDSNVRGIDYGSLVEVKTLDRRSAKFRVTDMTEDGLGGNKGFYRYEDMKSLRVENPAAKNDNSALHFILGALGFAALIALAISSDSVSICSGTPCPEPPQ